MRHYLEFSTDGTSPYHEIAHGAALHDGDFPDNPHELNGVILDGTPVPFTNPNVVAKIHKSLVISRSFRAHNIPFHCISFAAAMMDIPLSQSHYDPVVEVNTSIKIDGTRHDWPVLSIGAVTDHEMFEIYRGVHMVVHTPTENQDVYIHKLGSAGPLCISGLQKAMQIYGRSEAYPAVITSQ